MIVLYLCDYLLDNDFLILNAKGEILSVHNLYKCLLLKL